jgi:hypothetical protein
MQYSFTLCRVAAALVVVGAVAGCCGRGCASCAPTESYVNVPETLEEAEALRAPPEVEVEVRRQKRRSGGAACHSAVCVIILPFILWEAFFPEQWDQVTVTKGGRVTMTARYSTKGKLLEANLREEGVERAIAPIHLRELNKNLILEVARTPIDAEGNPTGPPQPSELLPQVDLTSMYRDELEGEDDDEDRGYLLAEYGMWLKKASYPFLGEMVPREPDGSAKIVVEGLCKGLDGGWTRTQITSWDEGYDTLLDMVKDHPGLETTTKGFVCAAGHQDAPRTVRFGRKLVHRLCTEEGYDSVNRSIQVLNAYESWVAFSSTKIEAWSAEEATQVHDQVSEVALSCGALDRRVYLQSALGLPIDDDELIQALTESRYASRIASIQKMHTPQEVDRIFRLLSLAREAQPPLIDALAAHSVLPTSNQYERLAEIYGQRLEGGADPRVRADLLDLFELAPHHSGDQPELATKARAKIWSKMPAVTPAQWPLLQIALVVLGESDQELPASRGLEPMRITPFPLGEREYTVYYGLKLVGCRSEDIVQASQRAAKVPSNARGRLCAEGSQ